MTGHEPIIAMRNGGKRPSFVFLNDYPCETDWHGHGEHATVCTAGDVVQLLDLRFLVGLRVSISSQSEVRAMALFEQCKAAGAECVGAAHIDPTRKPWDQSGWASVWHKSKEVICGRNF
jgi:hypothetical protein